MPDLRDLATEYEGLKDRAAEADCDCGPHTDEVDAEPCDIHDETVALDEEETERLAALTALDDQLFCDMEEYARNESAMIPDYEFEEYCREMASDFGYLNSESGADNPLMNHIDWDGWAEDVKHDYMEIEFDGGTYLIRAY